MNINPVRVSIATVIGALITMPSVVALTLHLSS